MKTYTQQDFHNPEQLTRQQVGSEYRLLLSEEVDGRWAGNCSLMSSQREWVTGGGGIDDITYRVPIATPLPDGAVLSSNECCFSDAKSSVAVDTGSASEIEQAAARIAKLLDERADCLAEVMLYRGENGDWTVEAGNPNACVMLGEVPGIIRAEGPYLLEALSNAENALTEREEKLRKKRVYCAGPMSSHPKDYNFPAFYAAAESLEKQGYEPVNPAQLDIEAGYTLERIKQLNPAEFQEFLKGAAKRDLDALQQCDAIALLPGWESSKGARAEKAVAEWLGLEVMYLGSKQENCEYCQGPCQSSTPSGCVGAEGESSPEKAPQISDAKQPEDSQLPDPEVKVLNLNMPKFAFKDGEYKAVEETLDTSRYAHGTDKQPDADGWIPHTPGDPMPCNPSERVEVKLGNGLCSESSGRESSLWYWGDSCTKGGVIVAWRPAQSKQPYNSDERAEWGVDAPTVTSTPQYAPDDPKGAAGAKKAPMWLLPPYALQQTAWVHKLGSEKYGPYNWRKTSVCATTYISAIIRHLDAWRDGEDNDPESGISHIAHVAASCNILLDAQHCDRLNDDRAKLCQI